MACLMASNATADITKAGSATAGKVESQSIMSCKNVEVRELCGVLLHTEKGGKTVRRGYEQDRNSLGPS